MKTINYSNVKNYGGLALDKRSREFKILSKKSYNTPEMIQASINYDIPIELISLSFRDLDIFHSFKFGILGNQLN